MTYGFALHDRRARRDDLARVALPVALLTLGLVAHGANSAALAAGLTVLLAAAALLSLLIAPVRTAAGALRENGWTALAAVAFAGWAALTALDWNAPWPHPAWAQFGYATGAASIAPYRTLEGMAAFGGPILSFLLGALAIDSRRDRDTVARTVAAFGLAFALYAIAQHLTRPEGGPTRLMVGFGSANAAATVFAMLAAVALTACVRLVRGRARTDGAAGLGALARDPIAPAALAIALAALMLTASRAGIASAALGLGLLGLLLWRGLRDEEGARWTLGALVLGVGVLAFVGAQVGLERLARLDADAPLREAMRDTHWGAFLARPWLGHGLNTFHDLNAHLVTEDTWQALRRTGSAHNVYLQLLEETGILGAALMAAVLAPIALRLLGAALGGGPGWDWAATGIAILFIVGLHGTVDFGLQTPAIAALTAFLLGAFSARAGVSDSREEAQRAPPPPRSAEAARGALVLGVAAIAAGAVVVYDAADAAESAWRRTATLAVTADRTQRWTAAEAAGAALEQRFSRPATWHAGAAAAAAWIEAARAQASGDPQARAALYASSAADTARALRLAPLQPKAWLHLGLLAEAGAPTLCTPRQCLEQSYRAAEVVEQDVACARLAFARRIGAAQDLKDPRVLRVARLYTNRRETVKCLAVLPPKDQFSLLLYREAYRKRQAAS